MLPFLLLLVQIAPSPLVSGSPRTTGNLTTLFAANDAYAGNMFDLTPAVDLNLTGFDLNTANFGGTVRADVWYRISTSFGNEDSATGWTLLASGTGTGKGVGQPTFVGVFGNGVTFHAGQSYGIYIDLRSYAIGVLEYTDSTGPVTFSNAELSLITNCGKGPGFSGTTFPNREWNGTVYYDVPPPPPQLTISGLVAGGTALLLVSGATPNDQVLIGYSLTGGGPTSSTYGDVMLSPPIQRIPPLPVDSAGNAVTTFVLPAGSSGTPLWVQGLDQGSGRLTSAVAATIG